MAWTIREQRCTAAAGGGGVEFERRAAARCHNGAADSAAVALACTQMSKCDGRGEARRQGASDPIKLVVRRILPI